MLKPLILSFFILPILGVLQGCAPLTYDYEWASRELQLEHDCHDIAGVYLNKGHTKRTTDIEAYLFDKITNEGIFGTHECGSCTVTLAWLDSELNELSVILYDSSGNILEEDILEREKGDFVCNGGFVSVGFAEGFEAYVEGYIASGTRRFFLAEDGSLVQKQHTTALGHMLIVIPLAVGYTDYSRWYKAVQSWSKAVQDKRSLYVLAMESDNNRERLKLLCQSAINGKPYAAAQLGLIYAAGLDGIKPNLIESYKWYGLADRHGQASAADAMLFLKQHMTKMQQSAAMRMLDDITDSSSCETSTD